MRSVSKEQNDPHRYDDLLTISYRGSRNRRHMENIERAAQFAPFAALTGYDDVLTETSRQTQQRREISEEDIRCIDEQLRILQQHVSDHPALTATFFEPDLQKEGGRYVQVSGKVLKIDSLAGVLVMDCGAYSFADIIVMECDLFSEIDG